MKIEIEGKCYHNHSNHELNGNAVILIQIIKHGGALFLRIYTFCELGRRLIIRLHVFPMSTRFSCHYNYHSSLLDDRGTKPRRPCRLRDGRVVETG
jgi:hypothetical protein